MATAITDISPIERELKLTLPYAVIDEAIKKELSKLRSSLQIKGFRKGKTPLSFIKRHYGEETSLRTIYKLAEDELQEVINTIPGQLIFEPAVKESNIEQVTANKEDLDMTFILAMNSGFTLKGLDTDKNFQYYSVVPVEEDIEASLQQMLERMGTQEEVDDVGVKDIIEVDMQELDGDAIKEDGVQAVFKFAQDLVVDEVLKEELIGKKVGDRIRFDITTLESGRPEDYIRKYILQLTEDDADVTYGNDFEGEILSITRHVPAEINEELFETQFKFSDDINNEEELRKYIGERITNQYAGMADDLLLKDFSDRYYQQKDVAIHEHYYTAKQILTDDMEDSDQQRTKLQEYTLQTILAHRLNLQPSEEDIRRQIANNINSSEYGYGLPQDIIHEFVENMMKNEEYVERTSQQIYIGRMVIGVKEHGDLTTVGVTKEEIQEKHEAAFPKIEEEE